ncbi:MAG: lysylphosphatidylglycerol synthase transmembrane domain-containing protein [Solirubrobacteraceae bacterium]
MRGSEPVRQPGAAPGAEDREATEVSATDLTPPPEVQGPRLRRRLLILATVAVGIVAVITLVPGLASLRERFAHGDPGWLAAGAGLKVLSGVCYVMVFRSVFCPKMPWGTSGQIGFSELGANAVIPTGGAGGLALGAWALRRGGMDGARIARRSIAFFFLTSLPNVLGVILIGAGLAIKLFPGRAGLALTLVPAIVASAAIGLTIVGGRWAGRAGVRLQERRGEDSRSARVLHAVADGVSESLSLLRHGDPLLLVGLAGYLAFDVMVLWATFNAFGSVPPLAIVWIGYLIGELGGLIPVPGGIGGVDVGLVGTFALYGVPVGAATAAVLAYRAIALVVPAVMGGVAFVMLRRTVAREALAVSGCEPGGEVEMIGRGTVRLTA